VCLDLVTRRYNENRQPNKDTCSGVGYKVFKLREVINPRTGRSEKRLCPLFYNKYESFKIGRYNKVTHTPRYGWSVESYDRAYHIFVNKRDAIAYSKSCIGWYGKNVIKQVKYRNVTATGTQNGYDVVVARELYIAPTKNRKVADTK
jgi:hypothetical protein